MTSSPLADRLRRAALAGQGWAGLVAEYARSTGRATRLLGTHGSVFAAADASGRLSDTWEPSRPGVPAQHAHPGAIDRAAVEAVFAAGATPVPVTAPDGFAGRAVGLEIGRRRIAIVMVEAAPGDRVPELLDPLLLPIAIEGARRTSAAGLRASESARFLRDVLRPDHPNPAGLARWGQRFGIDLHREHTAIAFHYAGPATDEWQWSAQWIETPVIIDRQGAWTITNADPLAFMARIEERVVSNLASGDGMIAAAGPPVDDVRRTSVSMARAVHVLALARHRGVDGLTHCELGLDAMLLGVDRARLDRFVHDTLGPILDRPELLETLRAWFATGGSRADTAEQLGVHPNSVGHRVTRAAQALGQATIDPIVDVAAATALAALEILDAPVADLEAAYRRAVA